MMYFASAKSSFFGNPKPYCLKTYTFCARNVYVFIVKRIPFAHETYTLHSDKLYLMAGLPQRECFKRRL